jgi:hypothetical protein
MAIVLDGTAGITTPDLTDTSLTSGRVVYAGASGNLTGSANLTYSGSVLSQTGRLQVYNTSGADGGFRLSSTGDVSFYDFEVSDSLGLEIQQGNTPRLTINTSGNIKNWGSISVGNVTPTTSGIGITFPATQSASSDANTLDDYEEGTWTPTLGGTATYSQQSGRYTKVGRVVTISFDLGVSTLGTGVAHTISGLPFAQGSGVVRSGITIPYYAGLAVNVISIVGIVDGAASSIFFSSSAASSASITDFVYVYGNGARIMGSGTYITGT